MVPIILPVLKPFTVTPGIGFAYRFMYAQGVPTSALPQNLTGYGASLTIGSWDGLTTYLQLSQTPLTSGSGIFFGGDPDDPSNGLIDIIIVASDTSRFNWKYAKYGMTLTPPGGQPVQILYGSFNVSTFMP